MMDSPPALHADLILYNAKIITVDSQNTLAEAVAIKEGKIIAVGTGDTVKPFGGDTTRWVDLGGKTVVPGFIDAHAHMDKTAANTKLAVSCHIPPVKYIETTNRVHSQADILASIKAKAAQTPKGEWIVGHGRFALEVDGHSPTRQQLDQIAPAHPVIIRYGAHAYLLNRKGLETVQITKDHPTQAELDRVIPGGKIFRDPVTGEPTGKLAECHDWVFPKGHPFAYKQMKGALQEMLVEARRFGITSINDLITSSETTRIYQELFRNHQLPVRIQVCPCVFGLSKSVDLDCLVNLGLQTGFGNQWLKFGSAKLFVDGDGHDENGIFREWLRLDQTELNAIVGKAHAAGLRVMMHANVVKGQELAINAIAAALAETPKADHRHRIEHFGGDYWPEGIDRLEALGIIPVPTPYSSYGWYGDAWLESARPEEKVVVYRTLLDRGFKLPGNSDSVGTMPEALNPWWSIWCAVKRQTPKGRSICLQEGVTVMEAIRMYTIHSAYAGFEETIKGSIETGKLADMAVLSADPFSVPPEELLQIRVEATIMDGQIVYNRENG